MNLKERLARKKESIENTLPPEYIKIMHNSTKRLEESGQADTVPGPDSKFPEFTLKNQNEEEVNLSEYLNNGPLIVTFYRGLWCPYCNMDLANLEKYQDEIKETGATMIAVSPEMPNYSKQIIDKLRLNFDILWDERNELAEKLNLKFVLEDKLKWLYNDIWSIKLDQYHGDETWTLPMPARFLIDTDGMIKYAEASPDYTTRPEPTDMLNILKTIK